MPNYPTGRVFQPYRHTLLSVERNNTEKVGLLIAECRRMGIEVLPPDVNQSGLDFTIEEQADGDAQRHPDGDLLRQAQANSPALAAG